MLDGDEAPFDHLEDTNPSLPVRPETLPGWRRAVGWLTLLGTLGLTAATIAVLISAGSTPEAPPAPTEAPIEAPSATTVPTQVAVTEAVEDAPPTPETQPQLSAEVAAAILNAPLEQIDEPEVIVQIERDVFNPFTVIPERPRNEVIEYEIVRGDTIFSIAERFGLQPETIAWSNDRTIIQVLRPGRTLFIPPVDGVYHTSVGSSTLSDIAARYKIDDPFVFIDSEFNPQLVGLTPDDVPPSGARIVIPNGEAEQIAWNPGVVREDGSNGGNQSGGSFITFAPGQPGSCGRQPNPGGGAAWIRPLSSYSWVRGFTSWHTGVDLSATEGAPVFAANGGRVIFAGWNNFGYGNTVVLAHGPFTTLYGHLSTVNVRCGETVVPGQPIAGVGNTGNSSGPHLHFEIRFLDAPQNPTATIPF